MVGRRWTKDECEKLKRLWPSDANIDEILKQFPGRTLASVYNKALLLRLKRSYYETSHEPLSEASE